MVNESRILKVTESLVRNGAATEIVALGLGAAGLPSEETWDAHRRLVRLSPKLYRRLPRAKSAGLYAEWYRAVAHYAAMAPIGVVHSNSLFDLPAAVWLKKRHGCPLVYDAHELETERHGLSARQRFVARVAERFLIRFADEVMVVSDSIAGWYTRTYSRRITVVRNKPKAQIASREPVMGIRERLGLSEGVIFLAHGALQEGRGVPMLIEAFARATQDRHLVFVGYGPLVETIRGATRRFPNIHYLEPVLPSQIVGLAASADVGLAIIEKSCLSYYYCLPNKLFECEAAGLPIIVSDFPDMGAEIDRWGNGWKIEPNPSAVLDLVNSITPAEIQRRALRSMVAATEATWDREEPALIEVYSRLKASKGARQ